MRHAAGAICRPNCMQFAYILSLPYKKCDYIISYRIASHCSRRVIPQLTKSAMGNARKLPSVPLSLSLLSLLLSVSLSCSSTSSDIFRKISTKIYSILAEYLLPSLSHLTHIHTTPTGSGSFFLSRLSSLVSCRTSLVSPSFYAVSFPRVICIFLPFGLFMIPHGEQAHARSLFIP